jgi:SAM-dependent methyltransferase
VSFGFEAEFFSRLMDEIGVKPKRMLVIGCGAGVEVVHLARATGATVVGIDLQVDPDWKAPGVQLLRADAQRMPFRDGAFDAVYCYHVLEHVPQPSRAIGEARRVLTKDGPGYFGTPNKSRLVGYVGGRATTWEKVAWNATDWGRRLQGRWSNEQGAHAGFTRAELSRLLGVAFDRVESVDLPYYRGKYPRLAVFWGAMFRTGFASFLAPSVYFRTRGVPGRAQGSEPGRS